MSDYFNRVPDFEYVSRLPNANISDYIPVKNLFKKGKLREDIFQDLAFFTKYQIQGDDRPDNVAFSFYEDSSLDWLVLTCNNILNVKDEWPLSQFDFNLYLFEKYGSFEKINEIRYYETTEIKNRENVTILQKGLKVPADFSISYYDERVRDVITERPVVSVTNYQYEEKLQEERRNIFLLKPRYLSIVFDDLRDILRYKKGSSQFKTESLKVADNIRLYS
jgi:hypothetical protein